MLELDLIRLTAQYVARNGKEFLTGLMSRESSNPQFGFLKPTHSLFSFFTAMADAYSKVRWPQVSDTAVALLEPSEPSIRKPSEWGLCRQVCLGRT